MPRININEIDNTLYSTNELTNDNIVYVPGNTITGEYENPVLLTTTDDFEAKFGGYGVEGSPTFDYVRGLLIAGLPVLFRRIVGVNQDSEDKSEVDIHITQAQKVLSVTRSVIEVPGDDPENPGNPDDETSELEKLADDIIGGDITTEPTNPGETTDPENPDEPVIPEPVMKEFPQLLVKEYYGGSYGNNLKVAIVQISQSLYFKVYYGSKVIEDVYITKIESSDTEDTLREKYVKFFKEAQETDMFKTVKVEVVCEDLSDFELPMGTWQLEGGQDVSDDVVIAEIPKSYDFIKDKYVFDVKFISAGGYTDPDLTVTDITGAQVALCEYRKDCFAILDIPFGTPKSDVTNYFTKLDTSFAAAYAPWCYTKLPGGNYKWMAPSYLFLYTLGRSIQDGNQIYEAPAGVLKASMPQVVKPEYEIGGDLLEYWTSSNPQCINPLMKLQSYGYVIYGQNTLYNIQNKASSKESALQKVNVRLAINEVRRLLFKVGIKLTFQANNIRTWNSFIAEVEPKLEIMKSNGGISDFAIQMDNTTTTADDIRNNTIRANVKISVMRAVENFEIDLYIEPQSVTFSDEKNSENVLIGGLFSN